MSSYEYAAKDIEREKTMVAALKRLSIGHMMNYDPDLPPDDHEFPPEFEEKSISRSPSFSKNSRKTSSTSEDVFFDTEEDLEMDKVDPSKTLWVPASLHPEVDPEQFKKHLKNTVEELLEKKLSRSGSINKRSSLSFSNDVEDDEDENVANNSNNEDKKGFEGKNILDEIEQPSESENKVKTPSPPHQSKRYSNPSLRDLTNELEHLSRMAGMDSTDAVTIARTLSTSSLGYTDVEKEAFHEMTSSPRSQGSENTPTPPPNSKEDNIYLRRSRRMDYRKQPVLGSSLQQHKTSKLNELRNNLSTVDISSGVSQQKHKNYQQSSRSFKTNSYLPNRNSQMMFSYKNPNISNSPYPTSATPASPLENQFHQRKASPVEQQYYGYDMKERSVQKPHSRRHGGKKMVPSSQLPAISQPHSMHHQQQQKVPSKYTSSRHSKHIRSGYGQGGQQSQNIASYPQRHVPSTSPSMNSMTINDQMSAMSQNNVIPGQYYNKNHGSPLPSSSSHGKSPNSPQSTSLPVFNGQTHTHQVSNQPNPHSKPFGNPVEESTYGPYNQHSGQSVSKGQGRQPRVSAVPVYQAQPHRSSRPSKPNVVEDNYLQSYSGYNQTSNHGIQPKQKSSHQIKTNEINQDLDLLRSEINEFKDSLHKSEVSAPSTSQNISGNLLAKDSDYSFDTSIQDLSYEDSLGIEREVLKELKDEQKEPSNTAISSKKGLINFSQSDMIDTYKKEDAEFEDSTLTQQSSENTTNNQLAEPANVSVSQVNNHVEQSTTTQKSGETELEKNSIPTVEGDFDEQKLDIIEEKPGKKATTSSNIKQYNLVASEKQPQSIKKKKSWPWTKERSVSQSSAEHVPNSKKQTQVTQRSVSSPEITEKPKKSSDSSKKSVEIKRENEKEKENVYENTQNTVKEKEKEHSVGKESVITKLFKKKRSTSSNPPQATEPVSQGVTVDYESDNESKKSNKKKTIFKIKNKKDNQIFNKGKSTSRKSKDEDETVRDSMEKKSIDESNKVDSITAEIDNTSEKDLVVKLEIENEPSKMSKNEEESKEEKLLQTTQEVQEKLKKSIRRTSKANQPIEFTDSAFGFPLPPPSQSTLVMLDYRFPVHVERAIYRLSHLKLANPKRSLREQVLLSNFMYAYLNLVDHTLHLEQQLSQEDESSAETEEVQNETIFSSETPIEESEEETVTIDLDIADVENMVQA